MTDEDIAKLLSRLTGSLATKEDIKDVKEGIKNVKDDVEKAEIRLGHKIEELNNKADTIRRR